jgi:hypothetical protein
MFLETVVLNKIEIGYGVEQGGNEAEKIRDWSGQKQCELTEVMPPS